MTGKIFGIPLLLILFLVLLLTPLLYADYLIVQVANKQAAVVTQVCSEDRVASPEVVATPSATIKVTPTIVKKPVSTVNPVLSPTTTENK